MKRIFLLTTGGLLALAIEVVCFAAEVPVTQDGIESLLTCNKRCFEEAQLVPPGEEREDYIGRCIKGCRDSHIGQ